MFYSKDGYTLETSFHFHDLWPDKLWENSICKKVFKISKTNGGRYIRQNYILLR